MSESRLFQILYHLLSKGEATASELAEKFEVSTRTIYRDIDRLSGAGIPLYTTTGCRGGIHLDENFVLKKSILSREDMQDILMGVQNLSALSFSNPNPIITKLQALFQMQDTDWIAVDYSRWGCDPAKEQAIFGLLKKAVQEKRQIHFQYYNSNGEASARDVFPLKLIFKDKSWYLYAHCLSKNAPRIFRISRIKELKLTNRHFENIPDEPVLAPAMEHAIDLELCFARETAHQVYDVFDEALITSVPDCLIVKVTMPEDEWLYRFLMSFGDKVTILKPPHLKDEIRKRFKAALKHLED